MIFEVLEGGFLPTYADEYCAGMDLYSPVDTTIPPRSHISIDLKIKADIPPGTYCQIKSRSGLAFKYDIEATNAGVIDALYGGNIGAKLYNHSDRPYHICRGDRICQMIHLPIIREEIKRGNVTGTRDGFGSTGK